MNKRIKKKVAKRYLRKIEKGYKGCGIFFFTEKDEHRNGLEKRMILGKLPSETPILLSNDLHDWKRMGITNIEEFNYFKKIGFIGTILNYPNKPATDAQILNSYNDRNFKNGIEIDFSERTGMGAWYINPFMVRTIY